LIEGIKQSTYKTVNHEKLKEVTQEEVGKSSFVSHIVNKAHKETYQYPL
jgi:hypothetical protein